MCASEKSGASQRFCAPERARSASGAQFVQACFPSVEKPRFKFFEKQVFLQMFGRVVI